MPTLVCSRERLFERLGRSFTDTEFEDLCFEFGVELDEVTTEQEVLRSQGKEAGTGTGTVYKIDLPANRYDLVAFEGFATALRVFLGLMAPPDYEVVVPADPLVMRVDAASLRGYRPHVECAVLRGVRFDRAAYESFIDVQEKFHGNLCKRRALASVGTHDLDAVTGPLRYAAVPRGAVPPFVPLKETGPIAGAGDGFLRHYREDKHLKPYLWMIEDRDSFPLVTDANGVVMSLPPIINSRHSQISVDTRNVFIEVTAVDPARAAVVLNQIVCAFSVYCEKPFTVEGVRVEYEYEGEGNPTIVMTPCLAPRRMECSVEYVSQRIGVAIPGEDMVALLAKMMLPASLCTAGGNRLSVCVPAPRTDVLHACDIMEDVAIAYGYERLASLRKAPQTLCVGKQTPIGKLSHLVRQELAQCGYSEVLSFSLCSRDEAFANLRHPSDECSAMAVTIANPQTLEFQMVRVSLLPGLLKCLRANKSAPLPLRLFEVGDVVIKDPAVDVGARNERRLAALFCSSSSSGFEVVHGLLDHLLLVLGCRDAAWRLEASDDPTYFAGRQARVVLQQHPHRHTSNDDDDDEHKKESGRPVGQVGVLHPDVLGSIDLTFPACYLELALDPFLLLPPP